MSITLTTDGLTLNGTALPAGTYTITTSSATLAGSGPSTSPNFSGSASITASGGTINLGPGSGRLTVGGNPLDLTNGATLDGLHRQHQRRGGRRTTPIRSPSTARRPTCLPFRGALQPSRPTRTRRSTFHANVHTSFADTYTLTAQAPPGWTVTVDANGNVTVTPVPGLQGGTFPIQLVAQSTTNPDLVAQSTVNVTVTPTQPGTMLSVQPDPQLTVPFNGARAAYGLSGGHP